LVGLVANLEVLDFSLPVEELRSERLQRLLGLLAVFLLTANPPMEQ
jgi:hypothetical protein